MKRTILIVEEDPKVRQTIRRALELAFYRVISARNGRDALALLNRHRPDLILTYLGGPLTDGWTLVKGVRARPEFALVPIVFFTSQPPEQRARAFRLGADEWLREPIHFRELMIRIVNLLERQHQLEVLLMKKPGSDREATTVEGNLEMLRLGTVLTILEMEQKSGELQIDDPGVQIAVLTVDRGSVIRAVARGIDYIQRDEEAIYRMLGWTRGTFTFHHGPVSGERRIHLSTGVLLMEGARRLDEDSRRTNKAAKKLATEGAAG